MDSYIITLLAFIVVLTFICRYFDYRKARLRAESEDTARPQLEEIRDQLSSVQDMLADILIELDERKRLSRSDEARDGRDLDGV